MTSLPKTFVKYVVIVPENDEKPEGFPNENLVASLFGTTSGDLHEHISKCVKLVGDYCSFYDLPYEYIWGYEVGNDTPINMEDWKENDIHAQIES